jgi:hypothetical protein
LIIKKYFGSYLIRKVTRLLIKKNYISLRIKKLNWILIQKIDQNFE